MATNESLVFNPRQLVELYCEQRFEQLTAKLLEILSHFERFNYEAIDEQRRYQINAFVRVFLFLLTQEDYRIRPELSEILIDFNSLIGNLAAISDFRTTDAYLKILEHQQENFYKSLILYNPHNTLRFVRRPFFDVDPHLASRWYFAFLEGYRNAAATSNSYEHLRDHISYFDERLSIGSPFLSAAYFGCTYYAPEQEGVLKRKINEAVQRHLASVLVENRPNRYKIGVFTAMWFPAQSVYRSQQPFIKALAADYELTLIHLGQPRDDLDTELFADVRRYDIAEMREDISAFSPNEFVLAYFPDVGMSNESIYLSNLRIAPIQVSNYGHPVSTYGSRIDYWIGGRETEVPELAERFYSERLILIPGAGQLPVYPNYQPVVQQVPDHPIGINCAWSQQKINVPLLRCLEQVLQRTDERVKFHFYPGLIRKNGYIPLCRGIIELLGAEQVEVHRGLDYPSYMREMEHGHFSIDCYPFGGYNSIIDSMFLRKPVVAWRGDRFYNRAGAFLLEKVGLSELIVDSAVQYVDLIVKLIDDRVYRREVSEQMKKVDINQLVFDLDSSIYFKQAIDYLIEHQEQLQRDSSRKPILIP